MYAVGVGWHKTLTVALRLAALALGTLTPCSASKPRYPLARSRTSSIVDAAQVLVDDAAVAQHPFRRSRGNHGALQNHHLIGQLGHHLNIVFDEEDGAAFLAQAS